MAKSAAENMRNYRARRKAEREGRTVARVVHVPVIEQDEPPAPLVDPPWPEDPAAALAAWSKARLVVPPGHARAGEPMELPAFAVSWLREALADGIREAGLFVARKNAKSSVVACLLLGCLAENGPLRRQGFRAGVASLNKDKSAELWLQMEAIAKASGLDSIRFGKVPRVAVSPWGSVEFLSADKSAGHASGFDLALVDELGLFDHKGRALVAGMLSSTSAKDGRLLAISILGDSPLTAELVQRAADSSVVVHVYQAPAGCALDDEAAWHAANPGMAEGIKSAGYMADMARRAAALPSEQANFRAFDLNQPGAPAVEMIVALHSWNRCGNARKPERSGPCFVGLDLGGTTSMSAAAAYWPDTGRLDCWGAFGDTPDLVTRGEADAVGDRYERMERRGELRTFPGRVTPVAEFLEWLADELEGESVELAAADRYRQGEAEDAMEAARVDWPMAWRAQGSGKDGSEDVRAFQRAVEGGELRPGESLLLTSAITESRLRYDGNGNPALDKARGRGRIDPLSAAVLAVGAGSRRYETQEFYSVRVAL